MSLWVLAGWVALSLLTAIAFALLRRRSEAVRVPHEMLHFLERFAREVREHHPAVEVRGMVPARFQVLLVVDGQETVATLHHLFRHAESFPDQFSELVRRFLDEVREAGLDSVRDHVYEQVAMRILPQVRGRAWLVAQGPAFGDAALVHRSIGADLVVCYVIDDVHHMVFVCAAHLRQWKKSAEEIHALALRNLERTTGKPLPVPAAAAQPVLLRTGDGYDAARVLLLDPDRVEGLLVAVPERDLLWMGHADERDLAGLMRLAEEQSRAAAHPVSPRLFRVAGGTLVPVDDELKGRGAGS